MSCLLREGLQSPAQPAAELFETVLAEAEVPDTSWRLGNYEIMDEIARGGMGVVYRARQRHSGRVVALKRVLAYRSDSHETLVRFRREAEAAAKLDHPNILPVYEIGESADGLPFFSMKYATGGSLRAAMPRLRERSSECVRLMAKVARAIDYAHREGVLHRDLQPGNILLDGNGEPLVSDFGLAKWISAESDLTQSLTTFGTPGYIAPEQAESAAGELGPAADVYSLGVVLFHLLSGRAPFVGTNVLSVIRQAAAQPAPKLRSFVSTVDRDLETICARCLERDPKARYQSAGELAEDLERWLQDRPIVARPVSITTRTWRWSRRNPVLAGAGLVCLALGILVLWLLGQRHNPPTNIPMREKSIAVLPFENLSDNRQDGYFATGVQEEILSDLARIADLKVISRTSTRTYKPGRPRNSRDIGRELGVAHLLEGSVQRSKDRLRIHAQLIDARSDFHLWGQTYDRKITDLFTLQSEIAQTIAAQLKGKIAESERIAIARVPTTDVLATDLYLEAIGIADQDPEFTNRRKAISLLERAIARDPHFVRAYCALARCNLEIYQSDEHTPSRLFSAKAQLENAAKFQSDSGYVHLIRAHYLARGLNDYDGARAELELARRALPNDSELYREAALLDQRQGRWKEALRNFDRAIELDPRNVQYLQDGAESYAPMRNHLQATRLAERVLALSPKDKWARLFIASQSVAERADIRPLRAQLEPVLAENESIGLHVFACLWDYSILGHDERAAERVLAAVPAEGFRRFLGSPFPREWIVGYTALTFKHRELAHTALTAAQSVLENHLRQQSEDAQSWSLLGRVKALLGKKEEAIAAGKRACGLWPLPKEPLWGLEPVRSLAKIYAAVGEIDLAVQQVGLCASQPSQVSYGDLKLSPDWDPLRGNPRFETIVASLAPKG